MKDISNYNLKGHNTFGIDVSCRRYIEFCTVDELIHVLDGLTIADRPIFVIGGGSNVLFTKDYDGTVLHSAIRGITWFAWMATCICVAAAARSGMT